MKNKKYPIVFLVLIVVLITFSCGSPFTPDAAGPMQLTQSALIFQATGLALQIQQATLDAAQNGNNPATGARPTFTPLPTFTQAPVDEASAATQAPAAAPTQDLKARIKKANVLIFEDIWGYPPLSGNRRVSMAVDRMAFSGGTVINTGDAYGDFKGQLTGSTAWDVIVVSGESRDGIKGEFYEYLYNQAQKGVGVVVELFNLNTIANGKIAPMLQDCGIAFQKDWYRGSNSDLNNESLIILRPDEPVFNNPNKNISLSVPLAYWKDADAGDIIRLTGNGDAKLLAGFSQSHKSDLGVLASCMGDRVFFQTFSTHDYRQDQTVSLWQNKITNALINHFKYMDEQAK